MHTASANQSAPAYCPPPKEFRLLLARFLSEIALLSCLFSAWPDACFSKPKGWCLEYFQGVTQYFLFPCLLRGSEEEILLLFLIIILIRYISQITLFCKTPIIYDACRR